MVNGNFDIDVPDLTYKILQQILTSALWNAGEQYADKPHLASCLKANIDFAQEEARKEERQPQEILDGFIRSERITVHAWNVHRLEDNIPEADTAFPLRSTARTMRIEFQQPEPLPEESYYASLAAQAMPSKNAERTTPASTKRNKTPKSGRGAVGYGKLDDAPSPNTPFPGAPTNITMSEMICFFPQWLKSVDVLDRMISNGGTASMFSSMVNTYRDMPRGEVETNSIYRMMQPSMRKRGKDYENWTVGTHVVPEGHDETSISVADYRTPAESVQSKRTQKLGPSIPFKELGVGVKQFPKGSDALDLTRCVLYHMDDDHQDEEWSFPDDFEALVNVLGGPMAVKKENYDGATINRWTFANSRAATEKIFVRHRDTDGRLAKRGFGDLEDATADGDGNSDADADTPRPTKRLRTKSLKPKPTRRKHAAVDGSDSDSEDAFKGSKRSDALGRKAVRNNDIRRSSRSPKKVNYLNKLDEVEEEDSDSDLNELDSADLSGS